MNNLTKTALSVFLAGIGVASAGTMGPVCTAGNVTVPCDTNAWDFGVHALYLQPIYGVGLGYLRNVEVAPNIFRANETKLDWDWGYKLEGAYHFNTGNDININWYHLNSKSNQTILFTYNEYEDDQYNIRHTFRTNVKWDAVNAEFGQHVDFGKSKDIRFHAGMQYARIQSTESFNQTRFFGTPDASPAYGTSKQCYKGVGPRIGADMTYNWLNGFSVYGSAATALLVGKHKYSESYTETSTHLDSGSKTAIVPELEGKLGAKYAYAMSQGNVYLDAGYTVVQYFEPYGYYIQSIKSQNDVGFHGPYAGLKWVGAL